MQLDAVAPVTFGLIAVNVIVFVIETLAGGSTSLPVALRFGAMTVRDLQRGQWWRLFTSMFVHFGFVHLICNMMSLYYLGEVLEQSMGSSIMGGSQFVLVVYICAGLLGNLLTWAVQQGQRQYNVVSAGASGAICGLLGVYVAMLMVPVLRDYMNVQGIIANVVLCLAPGMTNKSINMWAHLGGLIAGFLLGMGYFTVLFGR
ncbi:rhomboid family intramembrane serine protease [Pseudoscardovia suis]|uniref:Rhomboid family intramembrane serine protease n=1 Tax=Pseudoscardovia suis TaxID=987063 RepID=A0A261EQJ0_9BIFI|nr:rhomboid family intramembrane serine protease [Pseudoscardovia suis]OZG49114.1 rhomboid family intramembrane serine protease [Pseudoscardovia suis]PJJ66009.1 rhomboid protease GluP [Pseudoscardovia suis]